jgi:mediator of RNA polymerase II transcription subunit 18
MSSHSYEVALFGEFFAQDLKPIVNRITLHSESSQQMHYREIVFEPIDALQQRELGNEPVLLRARKEVASPDSKWYIPLSCRQFYGLPVVNSCTAQ